MLSTSPREIIANYSAWSSYPALLIPVLFALIILYGWVGFMLEPRKFLHAGAFETYALILGSALYLNILPLVLKFFRQVLLDRRRAIWLQDRHVIYLDSRYFTVSCSDVVAISLDKYGQRGGKGVAFLLKSGEKKVLPTGGLSIPADVVENRLRKVCLPETAAL